jgi:hypothetical protein
MTFNHGVLELIGKIKRLSFQRDWSHIQLKSESTGIYEKSRVSRTYPSVRVSCPSPIGVHLGVFPCP